MNQVTLVGRTTKNIELRDAGATKVANFTLAVNKPKKDADADFLNIVAFGKTAEILADYAGKGSQIAVEGRLQARSYDNKNGDRVYVTEVVANRVELLQTKAVDSPDLAAGAEEAAPF